MDKTAASGSAKAAKDPSYLLRRWVLGFTRSFYAALLLVALQVLASPALADSGPAARAREYFDQGAAAYREGHYRKAVEAFLKAYELDPHPELLYNVGQTYEKLGDVTNALEYLRKFVRLAPTNEDRPSVQERIRGLERKLSDKGVQQVTIYSTPSGARVLVDGKEVGKTPWTGELGPGKHNARLELEGYASTLKEFMLTSTHSIDVDVALNESQRGPSEATSAGTPKAASATPAGSSQGAATAPAGEQNADQGGHAKISPVTWVAFGVGAAALGGSLVFEFSRRSAEDDARASVTQVDYVDHYSDMESRQTAARVLLGIGAAATIAGGVLLYLDLSKPSSSSPAVGQSARRAAPATATVGLACVNSGCSIVTRGRF